MAFNTQVLTVTVFRPHANLTWPAAPCAVAFDAVAFSPGHIERRFVVPPHGATWATVVLRARGAARSRELAGGVVHMPSWAWRSEPSQPPHVGSLGSWLLYTLWRSHAAAQLARRG